MNASPSAVPCTSTKRSSAVITMFMSTSARTSSVYSRSSIGVPSMTPTEIAAHGWMIGCFAIVPLATSREHASCSAIQPPQIDAVRVPPSACKTSQSTVICTSGISRKSVTARNDRPISRWISCVRPLCFPRAASRSTRSGDEPGSIEYSAVTQPLPEPFSHGGTRASTDAVHSTRVRPNSTSTDPSAISVKSRTNTTARRSSGARPEARAVTVPLR